MKISPEVQEQRRRESIRAIANANIPKNLADRERVLQETLAFLDKFQGLSTKQVKELTLLRQKNGNVDPELVDFTKVGTAEALADAMDAHYHAGGQLVLLKGEALQPAATEPAPEAAAVAEATSIAAMSM